MRKVVLTAAPQATAEVLREEILLRDGENSYLGSEDDLIERLGVSRPTLRQAARILEQENLLVVRRGVNGGLFCRRPDASAVTHATAVFLRSRHASVQEVFDTRLLVEVECAALAAKAPRAEREEAMRTVEGHDFHLAVARLSNNTVNVMFVDVLINVAESLRGGSASNGHHSSPETDRAHARIRKAILDGDADAAAARMRRHIEAAKDVVAAQAADLGL
ncbi:FadR/GntR family transcriptional regulator [Rhodococcus sp. NPDC059968]|uniref:FadR/GntR family transcriptional regulator n=1 Tax=Rhodococcus sp. NPDC059968 TaxID=3347017 RepID=UPI0036718BCB